MLLSDSITNNGLERGTFLPIVVPTSIRDKATGDECALGRLEKNLLFIICHPIFDTTFPIFIPPTLIISSFESNISTLENRSNCH